MWRAAKERMKELCAKADMWRHARGLMRLAFALGWWRSKSSLGAMMQVQMAETPPSYRYGLSATFAEEEGRDPSPRHSKGVSMRLSCRFPWSSRMMAFVAAGMVIGFVAFPQTTRSVAFAVGACCQCAEDVFF